MGLRRQDRAIRDPDRIAAVIAAARVCRLGLHDGERPYVVPVAFGWEPGHIYFHSAPEGRKHAILCRYPRVCCEFETDVRLITHPERPCRWTFAYRSVIADGVAVRLEDPDAMRHGLGRILRQYGPNAWDLAAVSLDGLAVWRVDLERVSGKESLQKPEARDRARPGPGDGTGAA
jgi:nitroimidazol reductase NimA-like FMN-containing flavoprotein (pyridoxamine 5'-phosphate oxidase superfamily)